jgi:hypothetical protein
MVRCRRPALIVVSIVRLVLLSHSTFRGTYTCFYQHTLAIRTLSWFDPLCSKAAYLENKFFYFMKSGMLSAAPLHQLILISCCMQVLLKALQNAQLQRGEYRAGHFVLPQAVTINGSNIFFCYCPAVFRFHCCEEPNSCS